MKNVIKKTLVLSIIAAGFIASPARATVSATTDRSGFGAMFASQAPAAFNNPAARDMPMLDAANMDKAAAAAAQIDPAAGNTNADSAQTSH